MPSAHVWLMLLIAGVLLFILPATASASGDPVSIEVVAHDEHHDCIGEQAPCMEVVDQSWSLVAEGDELEITFTNNGTHDHTLLIASYEDADPANGTDPADAFLRIGPLAPGQTQTNTTRIPMGTDVAYLFCEVGDHEQAGMHLTRNVYPAEAIEEEADREAGIGDPNPTPIPLALVLVPLAASAMMARRHR